MFAHGSRDILRSARLYKTFEGAVSDIDFVVGTTAKNRLVKKDYVTPEKAGKFLK